MQSIPVPVPIAIEPGMPDPSPLITVYGPFGFGLVALIVLIGVVLYVWKTIKPDWAQRLRIAEVEQQTAQSLRDTAFSLERQHAEVRVIAEALRDAHRHMKGT